MACHDPEPVDIEGNFEQVASVVVQHLSQGEEEAIKSRTQEQQRELQLIQLTRVLRNNPLLLAVLEDPEWQRNIRRAAVPVPSEQYVGVTQEVARSIKPGSVLNVSYYKLPHKVVVETCSYSENKLAVTAIHYGRLNLFKPVTVMRENFQLLCNGSSAWLHTFPNSVLYSSEESLSRATSRLGERQHNPTGNNAHSLAVWCRVRDSSRNLDSVRVPVCDDSGAELHRLMPADHIEVPICGQTVHAVIASVESLDEVDDKKLLTVVIPTDTLRETKGDLPCFFGQKVLSFSQQQRIEKLQLELSRDKVEQNAQRFKKVHLGSNCTDLMALNFLATGTVAVPAANSRFTIHVSEIASNQVISYQNRIYFVLKVDRPERDDQTYRIRTVQYAPLDLKEAPKTTEFRLLISLHENRVQLVRHSEPDLQCPVLLSWKYMDAPLVNTTTVQDLSLLLVGDAISIQEKTENYPLKPQMPGLHAIVKQIHISNPGSSGDDSFLDVVCFNTKTSGLVEVKRVPVMGHVFSQLNFNVSSELLATREEALCRAESRLGTGRYCIAWNNSRDFVRWCCVNHKSNASSHYAAVANPADLACPTLPTSTKLMLQHQTPDCSAAVREVRLIDASSLSDAMNLLKLSVLDADWRVKKVQVVKIKDTRALHRVSRIVYNEERVSASNAQILSETVNILLGMSLANASDRRLGSGVSDRAFCVWLRNLHQAGLVELPTLLSADAELNSRINSEQVTDLYDLKPWDHVIIEKSQTAVQHMLVLEFNVESGELCGYTYDSSPEHDPSNRLDMYMYFPPEQSPYPMHKVICRTPVDSDASSELSSSLAAASSFPENASAWAQLCVLELESDLLLQPGSLNNLLKSMLKFAIRFAAGESIEDGSLQTCQAVLSSSGFEKSLNDNERCDDVSMRLYFIVRLIACLIGSSE